MIDAQPAHQRKAVTKAPINWNHLNADDRAKLEKMMAPYRAIEEAGPKGKRGGTIGHSGMCLLEAFLTFRLRRPGESLRLSREAIARAALLSPRTVGRTIQRLANLGLITIQRKGVYESTRRRSPRLNREPQLITQPSPNRGTRADLRFRDHGVHSRMEGKTMTNAADAERQKRRPAALRSPLQGAFVNDEQQRLLEIEERRLGGQVRRQEALFRP
jgi:DNA-binding transcriptional ArsR family regulator